MGDKPIWEQIGSSFIQHYYQLFDNDRTQLGAIYIDASCLTWEGQQFQGKAAIVEKLSSLPFQKIQHSITAQDHQPTPDSCIISMVVGQLKLGAIYYIDASCLTWEGQQFQGKAAIVEKLSSLPFQKIQHSITAQDHQPTPDSCIISMVVGQLKADEDPIMGFHQMFLLKNINDAWVCTNDMFRLALHNFG
ncbi:Nuclear transport factor 2 [Microtus ochrogaster]|nr:Nuclear transport factor 2 [Microtus ochrogaster]